MQRIAEKLEFKKGRAVKVCVKAGIGIKAGHEKRGFVQLFIETVPEKKIFDYSR